MDFSDALRAMKEGKSAYRRLWTARAEIKDLAVYIVSIPDIHGHAVMPQLMTVSPEDGIMRPFAGAQWDLLADDWEITE